NPTTLVSQLQAVFDFDCVNMEMQIATIQGIGRRHHLTIIWAPSIGTQEFLRTTYRSYATVFHTPNIIWPFALLLPRALGRTKGSVGF
ncbi:MAG: hypothetical protein KAT23_05685, partial [Anaerolineales bacterium]|nr:hypothetical protein [Anaerolineales bacterium]